jgi:NADPH:quinone reductase-like Zn-dependent oxidoreductase
MKEAHHESYRAGRVLELRDIDKPVAGDGEVLIRVRAAGVDQGVWHLMAGLPYLIRIFGYGVKKPKVAVRGREVAGVVEAVGNSVTRFQPGDEVYGTCEGSFAEYVCAKEGRLALKPANVTFEEAAAVPISAVTALQAVRDSGQVTPGQKGAGHWGRWWSGDVLCPGGQGFRGPCHGRLQHRQNGTCPVTRC